LGSYLKEIASLFFKWHAKKIRGNLLRKNKNKKLFKCKYAANNLFLKYFENIF
jgi:hypothetical protein